MPRALITGGLGAIGGATARHLVANGWETLLVDLVPESKAPDLDPAMSYSRVDIRDHDAVHAYLDTAPEYDAYIGVAGIGTTAPFRKQTAEGWRSLFEINVVANLVLAQASAERWIAADRGGAMVFVLSWIDSRPWPGTAAYSSSKAALGQLARTAALELAPYGIRVNTIAPGVLGEGMAGEEAKNDPEYARLIAESVPLGRLETSDDVAAGIAFLVSPGAEHMTGARLLMDGGTTLVSGAGVQERSE